MSGSKAESLAILRIIKTTALAFGLILGAIGALLLLPTVILPWRLCVWALAKYFRPELQRFVTGVDSLYTTDLQGTNFLVFLCLDGEIRLERFRALFKERVLDKRDKNGGKLYWSFWTHLSPFMGYVFYVKDKDLRLEDHVREYSYIGEGLALPPNSNADDLRRVTNRLLSLPWVESRSPWEFLLVPNFKNSSSSKTGTAIVFRGHHILGDGYCLINMISDLCGRPLELPRATFPKLPPWLAALSFIASPLTLFYDTAGQMLRSFKGMSPTWPKGKGEPSHDYHTALTKPIPVAAIKAIRAKFGVTFFAVILAALSEAYKKLLESTGETSINVPDRIAVFYPEPRLNHPGGSGNYTNGLISPLLLNGASFKDKAKEASQSLVAARFSRALQGADLMVNFISLLPVPFIRAAHANLNFVTFATSCLPMPSLALEGMTLIDGFVTFRTAGAHFAGNVVTFQFHDSLRYCINIDKKFISSESAVLKMSQYLEEIIAEYSK